MTESHSQNAKPGQKQSIARSKIGLDRVRVFIPSWMSVERMIALVIQTFLLLTEGGQGRRCGCRTQLTPPNTHGETPWGIVSQTRVGSGSRVANSRSHDGTNNRADDDLNN